MLPKYVALGGFGAITCKSKIVEYVLYKGIFMNTFLKFIAACFVLFSTVQGMEKKIEQKQDKIIEEKSFKTIYTGTDHIKNLCCCPNETLFAYTFFYVIYVFNVQSGECIRAFNNNPDSLHAHGDFHKIDFANNEEIISFDIEGRVKLWNIKTGNNKIIQDGFDTFHSTNHFLPVSFNTLCVNKNFLCIGGYYAQNHNKYVISMYDIADTSDIKKLKTNYEDVFARHWSTVQDLRNITKVPFNRCFLSTAIF